MSLVNVKNVESRLRLEKFLTFKKNNLVLRISQQSLVKGAWAFSHSVAALIVTHSGA